MYKRQPYEREGSNIKGLARIYFENSFIVNNINIVQGKEKIFVSMPSYKTKQVDEQGKPIYQDVCYPVTKDFREDVYKRQANGWETKIDENGHVVSDDAVQKKHNFHYNLWEMEKGGAKTRYQWNMDAIRTLKQIESENRLATPGEQKVLSKFVGWGGLSQAFDEENAGWSKEYAELKELLSDEEYSAARATVNNAFYTSPEIAMCMNSAL